MIADLNDLNFPPWERGVRQGGNMNIPVMTTNLLAFKNVLDFHGIKFVLFFGTLLGVIRQNAFIPYDTDIDVLVFGDQYRDWLKAKKQLREMGFYIPDDKPLHDEHVIRGGEKIEMWWCSTIKDQLVYDNNIRFNTSLILPTQQVNFLGESFEIPNNSKAILELLYGPTWQTPNQYTKGCSYKAHD